MYVFNVYAIFDSSNNSSSVQYVTGIPLPQFRRREEPGSSIQPAQEDLYQAG